MNSKILKNIRKNITSYLFTAIFGLFVIVVGILSFSELLDHYINDRPDYHQWVPALGSRLETDISNNFFAEFEFVNYNGLMRRLIGQREMNGVVRLDNGYLYKLCPYFEDEDLSYTVGSISKLNDYLTEKGIPFIYVITPNTSSKYDPCIPVGMTDYGNDNLDRLFFALKDRGVDVIDMRQELHNDGIDSYSMMYRTDHHWTTKMGFYTYEKLVDIIEPALSCEVDPVVKDINNYTIKTYKRWHLGSRGQRTGEFYGGIDDFDLITPNFETHVMTADGEKEGEFTGVIINTESLKKRDLEEMREDVNNRSTYDRVLESTKGEFVNLNSHNDKRILMTTDSFGEAVMPYMDISFSQVKWVEGNISSRLINEFEPDAVVMIYDMSDNFVPHLYEYDLE